MKLLQLSSSKKTISYLGMIFVVCTWGTTPLITLYFYKYYSPSIRLFFSEIILFVTFLCMTGKRVKEFDYRYIKLGIPTGIFLSLANLTQKIGLMYTTPARYAFLENLSCVVVPILMFLLVRKKSGILTVLSCFLALASVFILNGLSFDSFATWGIGEILCASAGIFYGFNIAYTGAFAGKLYAPLYLAVQSAVSIFVTLGFSLALNFITITNEAGVTAPIEKIVFSFNPCHIFLTIVFFVVAGAFCWTIRTNALKHIEASAVAIIMPFAAVITSTLSVILGKDTLTLNLVIGGTLGFIAVVLSGFDSFKKPKKQLSEKEQAPPEVTQ